LTAVTEREGIFRAAAHGMGSTYGQTTDSDSGSSRFPLPAGHATSEGQRTVAQRLSLLEGKERHDQLTRLTKVQRLRQI
jgi:hypothetical protein